EDAVALQLLDLVEQEVQRRTGPLRHLIHSFARHGCSTTLPQRPSMSVLNACAKSSMAKRCVMTGVTSSPPCNSRVIWYHVSNRRRPLRPMSWISRKMTFSVSSSVTGPDG